MIKKEINQKELEKDSLNKKMKLLRVNKQVVRYFKPKFKIPCVGVGVFLAHPLEDKILLGRRKDSGLFGLPGGWLEIGEEWEICAARELREETGLLKQPDTFKHVHTLNCKFLDYNYHNISCIMYNEVDSGDLTNIRNEEPHKCYGWFWTSFIDLRTHIDRLFYPLRDFLRKFPDLKNVDYLKNMIKSPI